MVSPSSRSRGALILTLTEQNEFIFKEDALKSFVDELNISPSTPVCIISVIGEPKAGKTFLTHNLIHHISRSTDMDWEDGDGDPESLLRWANTNDKHGICIHYAGILGTDAKMRAVFILDILAEDPVPEIYVKLVDYCIVSSTAILYSSTKYNFDDYLWSPLKSTVLKNNGPVDPHRFCSIILSFWPFPTMTEEGGGQKFLSTPPEEYTEDVLAIKIFFDQFKSTFQTVTCHLIPKTISTEDNQINSTEGVKKEGLQTSSFQNFITSTINQLEQSSAHSSENNIGTIENLRSLLWWQTPIEKRNSITVIPPSNGHSADSNEMEHSGKEDLKEMTSTPSSKTDDPSPPSTPLALTFFKTPQIDLQLSECLDKYKSEFNSKLKHCDQTGTFFLEEEFSKFHETLSQQILTSIFGTTDPPPEFLSQFVSTVEPFLQHFRHENSSGRETIKEYGKKAEDHIKKVFISIEKKIGTGRGLEIKEFEDHLKSQADWFVRRTVPERWSQPFRKWFDEQYSHFWTQLDHSIHRIQNYKERMRMEIDERLFLNLENFDKLHRTISSDGEGKWPKGDRNSLNEAVDEAIKIMEEEQRQRNNLRGAQEEMVAKAGMEFALDKYQKFMENAINSYTLTRRQVQNLHKEACGNILSNFLNVSPFTYSDAWQPVFEKLFEQIPTHLEYYLRQNQIKIDGLMRSRKSLVEECLQIYTLKMKNDLETPTRIEEKILQYFHTKNEKEATGGCQNLPTRFQIEQWTQIVRKRISILFQTFKGENDRKSLELVVDGMEVRKSFLYKNIPEDNPSQPFGVGFYLNPTVTQVTVTVMRGPEIQGSSSSPPTTEHHQTYQIPPLIAFTGEKILIGEKAENYQRSSGSTNIFDVYKLLMTTHNIPKSIQMYGENYALQTEAIVAIYFHQIRLRLELTLTHVVTSCVVTLSPHVTMNTKHILKVGLDLAGFSCTRLLQSTTASGIHRLLTLPQKLEKDQAENFLIIHKQPGIFDVALGTLCNQSVCMRALQGLPVIQETAIPFFATHTFQAEVQARKNIIDRTLDEEGLCYDQIHSIIYIDGSREGQESAPLIYNLVGIKHRCKIRIGREEEIAWAAVILDAHQNQQEVAGVSRFNFQEVSPYTIVVGRLDDQGCLKNVDKILIKNKGIIPLLGKVLEIPILSLVTRFRVVEKEVRNGKENSVYIGHYNVTTKSEWYWKGGHKKRDVLEVKVFTSLDGLFNVELPMNLQSGGDFKISSDNVFMVRDKMEDVRQVVRTLCPRKGDQGMEVSSDGGGNTGGGARSDKNSGEKGEARMRLASFLKDVKEMVEESEKIESTSDVILDFIKGVIKESEGIVEKGEECSEKVVKAQMEKLERAAGRIKLIKI